MVESHYPRCLECFSTQENVTTKTLNPKVTSFVIQVSLSSSSPSKTAQKHLYSSIQLSKMCHVFPNCDTVGAYDQPYHENVPDKLKIMTRLDTLQNMLSTLLNRDTPMKSCHDFSVSPNHKFEANNNNIYSTLLEKPAGVF